MSGEKQGESGFFKALKLIVKVDWKSMLLILTALAGAGGAVWNKVELYLQQYQQQQIALQAQNSNAATGGAYDALATRIDELFMRIESLEAVNSIRTHYVPIPVTESIPPLPKTIDLREDPDNTVPVEPEPEPVSRRFKNARLPEFQSVQQAARHDLEQFLEQVKAE